MQVGAVQVGAVQEGTVQESAVQEGAMTTREKIGRLPMAPVAAFMSCPSWSA
jgi:hypothetical protein